MSLSAWITSILVALVLYGGFGWCVAIAVRKERERRDKVSHGGSERP
jgi:hypothetical protein